MKNLLLTLGLLLIFINVNAKEKIEVTFNKCVDGDTAWFVLDNKVIKARFLAIDTPESTKEIEPYGKEASTYTCNELKKATTIEVEYDENSDMLDKYDRHLVWIYVDNTLLQNKIIRNGYGEVAYLYGNYKYIDTLKESEKQAQQEKLNMWSDYEEKDNTWFIIVTIGIIIIIYLFIPKYRKKINKKLSNKLDKKLTDVIDNI